MPVGHARLNNPNADPNPDITFIRVLEDRPDSDKAREILEALAAQFRPITKARGFAVGSLEEHEWYPQFAGKCWNHGECIQIVLRRRNGSFTPYQWLLYTMCHELSHIPNRGHGHSFQKLNKELRADLAKLRAKGYWGDGFWSAGRELTSGKHEAGFRDDELPTYTCGGSFQKRKGGGGGRSRGQAKLGWTGRQTPRLTKAGGRVKKIAAFDGKGHVLDGAAEMSSFRRHAGSKSAIEARAAAAEERLKASKPKLKMIDLSNSTDDEWDDEVEWEDDDPEWSKTDLASWQSGGIEVAETKGAAKKRVLFLSDSDSDDTPPPKKPLRLGQAKPKSIPKATLSLPKKFINKPAPAPAPAPAPGPATRTWRATSEERESAAKDDAAKPTRRPPQKYFSTGTSVAKAHAQLGKARQAAYPSRQPKKQNQREPGQPMLVRRPKKAALQPHEVAAKALQKGLKQRRRNERALVEESDDE